MSPPSTPHDSELARLVAEMAELAGGLAHELRNPLSTMMINLKLLAEDLHDTGAHPDDSRRRALLKVDVLRREAERLQSLFDEFLNLTAPHRLERRREDVNAFVTGLLDFFEPTTHGRNIEVRRSLCDRPLLCEFDPRLLRQAMLNIVINAQEAMPRGGVLQVATTGSDDGVSITVSDTGPGIADTDREKILRPFFSTKARGSGLGLSVTQRIIHEHGGTLRFESRPGRGAAFTIHLPCNSVYIEQHQPDAADPPRHAG